MLRRIFYTVMVCLVGAGTAFAQSGTLTGTVTEEDSGEPIIGANIFLEELQRGATTDIQGEFEISNIDYGTYTLRISYIGYDSQEQQIIIDGPETNIDVSLVSQLHELDDVIVTAYGITREKRSVAYQTESISAEDLNTAEVTSAAEGLVGKVAGLQINHQNSGVDAENQIILRGLRSVSGENEALIVIDGSIVSQGAFSDLNPNDIENINVLKGATAAAIYGADASNGVLVVTTKKGGQGFTAGYSHSTTWQEVAYLPDHQKEFGMGWDGVYMPENTNWGPRLDGEPRRLGPDFPDDYLVEDEVVPFSYVDNQLKDFFNRGATAQNTIYLSGGDETGSFYLSVGNNNTTGVIPEDEYNRQTFTANGSKRLGDVTLGVNASYFQDEKNVVGDELGDQDRAMYWFLLNTPINAPLTKYSDWQDPTSYGYANNYFNPYYQNPYWAIGTSRDIDETDRLRGNISASWDIADNINLTGTLGLDSHSGIGKDWRAAQEYDPSLTSQQDVSSFVEDYNFQSKRITGNVLATGEFQLTEDVGLRAIVGSAVKMSDFSENTMRANNLSIPDFYDISNGTGQIDATVDEYEQRLYGFFGDFQFDYKEWAFLNVTGRQDYTSTLPSGDNSYFYPGVGVTVILNEAIPAINDISFISMIKLTANNSTVYKDLDPYEVNERYLQSTSFPYGDINGFYLSNVAVDEGIQKEKLNSTEFGLNAAFLNGRITLDAAYFFTQTTNLITEVDPSNTSGSTGYLTNIGKLSGSGVELTLGADVISSRDFVWNVSANYTSYEQVVDEIQPGTNEIAMDSYSGFGTYAIKGEVFPQIKAVSYVRDNQGRVVVDPVTGNPLIGELEAQGKTTPDYVLGLNTSVNYKGFRVSATMDYRTGHVYYAQGQDMMEFTGRSVESAAGNRDNFVWPNSSYQDASGDYVANTNIPITGGVGPFWRDHYNEIKENYVKDATAFKLRELAVNYTVPNSLLGKTKAISKLTLGVVGRNLLTVLPSGQTKFSDPEFKNTREDDDPNGIGIGGYLSPPPTRSYGFSVNIEF